MMKNILPRLSWIKILITSIITVIGKIAAIAIIVAIFAFKLGVEAHGTPDQAKISEFAATIGRYHGQYIGILLTFFGAIWVAHRTKQLQVANTVALGLIVAMVNFILHPYFNFTALVVVILTLTAGWAGGLVGRGRNSSIESGKT